MNGNRSFFFFFFILQYQEGIEKTSMSQFVKVLMYLPNIHNNIDIQNCITYLSLSLVSFPVSP